MSHTAKRDAETAFEGDANGTPAKKKRSKRRRAPNDPTRPSSSSPTNVKHTPKKASKPDITPTPLKLEERITPSKPKTGQLVKTEETVKKRRKGRSNTGSLAKTQTDLQSWSDTSGVGGFFIDHDPILTTDGARIVLPTKDQILVYSTATSLLVRSISGKGKGTITSCATSIDGNILAVTRQGSLIKYNISTGHRMGQWKIESGIQSILPVSAAESGEQILALRSVEGQDDELLELSLQEETISSTQLLRESKLHGFTASADGSVIVVRGTDEVHVAKRKEGQSGYSWLRFDAPGTMSCLDLRVNQLQVSTKKGASYDLVIGLDNGSIFIYRDILPKLTSKRNDQTSQLNGRKLHWHRSQVRSVRWSRDGNYVVSGGDESVLVIWQLDTNQQQFLPHLSTTILNITVSISGAHYALRLGDNSVMVLSTADLLPSSNISGLSLPRNRNDHAIIQLHPLYSNQLLAAIPIRPNSASTHLQTYDIDTNLQLNRQALTRNITTAVNVSPEGHPLQEPIVTHMQISYDGSWLATVDKWSPNTSDIQGLYLKEDDQKPTETVLRFWSWNDNSWELVTRIDEPHTGKSSVLALVSNPAAIEFTMMGEDGIKIWRPRRRVRDGVQVRNNASIPLFTWTCTRSIPMQHETDIGVLAYSEDGSVLAASWSCKQRQVYLIDPQSGKLCMSLPYLLEEGVASMAIVGRHLLCLSNSLKICDMITLQTTFNLDFEQAQNSFLVVNKPSNTFAVGMNVKKDQATISVFNIETPDQGALKEFVFSGEIQAVLAEPSSKGYVVVDRDCKVRRLMPPGGALVIARTTEETETNKGLAGVFGRQEYGAGQQMAIEGGPSRTLVDVLSAPSTSSQAGVSELFDRVSRALLGSHTA